MPFDTETLYKLLPATYRVRDAEQGEPLKALIAVLAEQALALEENLDQLYDDQFIETCAEWVAPYIGDLIGYRELHGVVPRISSPRAEVANTIAYRRHKGTAAMLEQLARDVTGWPARAVEFFQLLATTQYMNHIRGQHLAAPDLRKWKPLERIGTPFDPFAHTADIRHISARRGKYNIPNVGIFLWRLQAYSLTGSPAFQVDARRYMFSPLGNNTPLYNLPVSEAAITHIAEPANVPMPLSRRVLDADLLAYYGADSSLAVFVNGAEVARDQIVVCNLSDTGGGWAHQPADKLAVDPALGRLALPANAGPPADVRVSFYYGFSADMGGGEYQRAATFDEALQPVQPVVMPGKIQDALDVLAGAGAVEIGDSGRYEETLSISAAAGQRIELRAADEFRPTIVLGGELLIAGGDQSEVTLNGLLISGGTLRVRGQLRHLRLRHCTLVPGLALALDGNPVSPDAPALIVESGDTIVEIESCIVGGLRVSADAEIQIANSILDATSEDRVVYAGLDAASAGGTLQILNSTAIGKIWTQELALASNAIFLARLATGDTWQYPLQAERRQAGCVRFSFVPPGSRTPRRYRCQPESEADAARVRPQFTSLHYGDASYGQLSVRCAAEIRTGADDESEIGAFHDLFEPQRETNLRVRLDEYLRFGLEAGIFYAS
jgi:hypothetical protein